MGLGYYFRAAGEDLAQASIRSAEVDGAVGHFRRRERQFVNGALAKAAPIWAFRGASLCSSFSPLMT